MGIKTYQFKNMIKVDWMGAKVERPFLRIRGADVFRGGVQKRRGAD